MRLLSAIAVLLIGCAPRSIPDAASPDSPLSGSPDAAATTDAPRADAPAAAAVTWYRDVLPIVRRNCGGCHVAGGVAPFALTTFEDASPRHPLIAQVVRTRQMPPWLPDPACQHFADARGLSDAQIATLVAWSEGGAAAGDPADAPTDVQPLRDALERADMVLALSEPYTPAPDPGSTDEYRCLVLDPHLDHDVDIEGYELRPGVRRMLHHANLFSVERSAALAQDAMSPGLGWRCGAGGTGLPSGLMGVWLPGRDAARYPATTGIPLHATDVLVLQIHYNVLAAPPEPDRTAVALQFATGRAAHPAWIDGPATSAINLPPHSSAVSSIAQWTAPRDAVVWGVVPHMHELGRSLRATLGATCMVNIPAWHFHWQQFYFYDSPTGIPAAAGAMAEATCTWDNPTDRTVTWGEGTRDEMCGALFYLTAP